MTVDWLAILFLIVRLGITAALYAFLAWAFWVMWHELRSHARLLNAQQIPSLRLRIALPNGSQTLRFQEPEVHIGRDVSCDCILPDATISARHARLSYHHQQWWLEDLNSTNGTFIHEEAITTPVVLTSGDQIRCGRVDIQVQIERSTSSEAVI